MFVFVTPDEAVPGLRPSCPSFHRGGIGARMLHALQVSSGVDTGQEPQCLASNIAILVGLTSRC